MREKTKGRSELEYFEMDATDLEFANESFDAAIDKGTMDALLCGDGSTQNVSKLCSEVSRVLVPGGRFIVISYGQPDHRMSYLKKADFAWNVEVQTIPKSPSKYMDDKDPANVHYCYVCTKRSRES